MKKKSNKENPDDTRPPFKERLQMAVSSIMDGTCFIEEAVAKYEVLPSSIIVELKKIQKLKKEASIVTKKKTAK